MTNNLLPCPFCGGDQLKHFGKEIQCQQCQALGPLPADGEVTHQIATDWWNRRPQAPAQNIVEYYERQIAWSRKTFGPALRTKGVIDHIRKELREIEQDPHDLSEWIDVVILAMDGFWRHGGQASDLMPALIAMHQKNMARTWPDWHIMSEDSAIEHDRSEEKSP